MWGGLAVIIVGASPAALQPAQVETANRVVVATNNGGTMPPLPPGDTPELEIPDIIGRLMAPADDRIRGKKVQVTGQLSVENGVSLLSRVVIICCAADARAYQIELSDPRHKLRNIPAGTWVHATVTLLPGTGTEQRNWVPIVVVEAAEPTADPGYGALRR